MPGYDRRGPMGEGPMTGGGRGYCNSVDAGYGRSPESTGFGRGMAYGRGFRGGYASGGGGRRGFGRGVAMYPPAPVENPADELSRLKQQADSAKNTLCLITTAIADTPRNSR